MQASSGGRGIPRENSPIRLAKRTGWARGSRRKLFFGKNLELPARARFLRASLQAAFGDAVNLRKLRRRHLLANVRLALFCDRVYNRSVSLGNRFHPTGRSPFGLFAVWFSLIGLGR